MIIIPKSKNIPKSKEKEFIKPIEEAAYTKDYESSDLEIPAFLRRQSK